MKPDDVAASYDQIADRWNSDGFNRSNGIAQHEHALSFAPAGGPALDVGCGSSGRFISLLDEYGFEVEGIDISSKMVALARARHPDICIEQADVCVWEPEKDYAFITAWDSIWHVPLTQSLPVLQKLLNALLPGGVLIFTTGGVDAPAHVEDEAMGVPMYHSAPGLNAIAALVIDEGCICRHLEYDQYPEQHVYMIIQKSPA